MGFLVGPRWDIVDEWVGDNGFLASCKNLAISFAFTNATIFSRKRMMFRWTVACHLSLVLPMCLCALALVIIIIVPFSFFWCRKKKLRGLRSLSSRIDYIRNEWVSPRRQRKEEQNGPAECEKPQKRVAAILLHFLRCRRRFSAYFLFCLMRSIGDGVGVSIVACHHSASRCAAKINKWMNGRKRWKKKTTTAT